MAINLTAGIELMFNKLSENNLSGTELESTEVDKGFIQNLQTLGINIHDFKIDGDVGNYHLTRINKVIDNDRVIRSLTTGNLLDILDSLGINDEELTQRTLSYQVVYKNIYNQQRGIKNINNQIIDDEYGKQLTAKLGDPKTEEDLNNILKDNPNIKAKFDKFKKKIVSNDKTTVGKWTKRVFTIGALSIASGGLWKVINDHKKSMNGCWLVNAKTGDKCKIQTLTCNGNTHNLCSPAEMKRCGSHLLPEENTSQCFANDKCMKQDENGKCIKTLGNTCSGNKSCNKYCGKIRAPLGYKMTCVSTNFWGAANDLMGNLTLPLSSWWKYILIGIVVVIIIIVLMNI
jgi:hypothetical protein